MEEPSDDYTRMPEDKAELMARVDGEWRALEQAISGLSDEQMSIPDAGGWSIKDNLAHLAAWERFLRMYYLRNLPPHEVMGVDEATFQQVDEDGMNAILYQRNKDRSVADVLAELHSSHQQVLADLGEMSFEEMMRPRYADDPQARPLMSWIIGNTYEHYREHRASIEKLANSGHNHNARHHKQEPIS